MQAILQQFSIWYKSCVVVNGLKGMMKFLSYFKAGDSEQASDGKGKENDNAPLHISVKTNYQWSQATYDKKK